MRSFKEGEFRVSSVQACSEERCGAVISQKMSVHTQGTCADRIDSFFDNITTVISFTDVEVTRVVYLDLVT